MLFYHCDCMLTCKSKYSFILLILSTRQHSELCCLVTRKVKIKGFASHLSSPQNIFKYVLLKPLGWEAKRPHRPHCLVFFSLHCLTLPPLSFQPYLLLSLSSGAFTVVTTAGSHSQGDESRDHPEAAGTQLWPNWEHQQLPQSLCAAAHQCQVRFLLFYLCHHIIMVIIFCSHLSATLLL